MDLRSGTVKSIKDNMQKSARKSKNQTNNPTMEEEMKTALQGMLNTLSTTLSHKIDNLQTEVHAFRADIKKDLDDLKKDIREQSTRIEEVEERVGLAEERETTLVNVIKHLSKEAKETDRRLDYFENKSRQNNIRIYNVNEKYDSATMISFVQTLINETLNIPIQTLNITAAHRSAVSKSQVGLQTKARSIIVRFHTLEMREKVLQTAWGLKTVKYRGEKITFSQDFTSKVQTQRNGYKKIRDHLKEKGIIAYVKAPAKLKVIEAGGIKIYNTPKEAEEAYGIYKADSRVGDLRDWEAELRTLGWEKKKNG